ncbi:MAG: hypothetical protein LBS19_13750 [Clostridiales bacterium]|jgi:hypothetical protein|nr:hypothetical protein [Clostridiales bacterium]
MEQFGASIVTEAGASLRYIKPTKLSVGGGVNEFIRYDAVDNGRIGNELYIIVYLDSADFTGAYIRELGLYVENPDGREDVLYAVSLYEGANPPFLSSGGINKVIRVTMRAVMNPGAAWRGNAIKADIERYTPLTMFQPIGKNGLWYGEHRHDKADIDGLEDAGWSVGDVRFLSYRLPEYPRSDYLSCDGRQIDLNEYPNLKERWDYGGYAG